MKSMYEEFNLLKRARACYHRLCPHAQGDVPVAKSTTMQAFIEGATIVSHEMLKRERDIWHELHTALNKELQAYKQFLNSLVPIDDGELIQTLINDFQSNKDRL